MAAPTGACCAQNFWRLVNLANVNLALDFRCCLRIEIKQTQVTCARTAKTANRPTTKQEPGNRKQETASKRCSVPVRFLSRVHADALNGGEAMRKSKAKQNTEAGQPDKGARDGAAAPQQRSLMFKAQVLALLGDPSYSTVWEWMKAGKFPLPIELGPSGGRSSSIAWYADEIHGSRTGHAANSDGDCTNFVAATQANASSSRRCANAETPQRAAARVPRSSTCTADTIGLSCRTARCSRRRRCPVRISCTT